MEYQDKVKEHYGASNLSRRIQTGLESAGLGGERIEWSDISLMDQFHVGGLKSVKEIAAQLDLQPDSKFLDVGSGVGGPARYVAATVGCEVTGVDLSPAFVDLAIDLTKRTGLTDRVSFVCANALELPFPDASFDRGWTLHVAMNIAERKAFYESVYRVLSPGALFAVYDVVAVEGVPFQYPAPWASTEEFSFLKTADETRELLEEARFRIVDWRETTAEGLAALEAPSPSDAPFSLALVMGENFKEAVVSLTRNLQEGRAKIVRGILRKE